VREISLNGGEISILKAIGLGGGIIAGNQLAQRMDDMETAELIDTLEGLITLGYVLCDRTSVRNIDAVKSATFRVDPAHARELRDAVYPSRNKPEAGRRRRRS
jgi:hypothetical protein